MYNILVKLRTRLESVVALSEVINVSHSQWLDANRSRSKHRQLDAYNSLLCFSRLGCRNTVLIVICGNDKCIQ